MGTARFLVDFLLEGENDFLKSEKIGFMCDIACNFIAVKSILLNSFYGDLTAFLRCDFPEDVYKIEFSKDISSVFSHLCIWKKDWERPGLCSSGIDRGVVSYCLESGKAWLSNFCVGVVCCSNAIDRSKFLNTNKVKIPGERIDSDWWLKYMLLNEYGYSWKKEYLMKYVSQEGKKDIFSYYRDQLLILKNRLEESLDDDVKAY